MKICLSCEGVTDTQAHRCGHCDAPLLPLDMVHYPARRGELDAGNPLLGTIIDGKYRLQSVLGRGGLGTVFRAQHVGSLVTVALKLLHPRFSERAEYRRALLPEARRAAAVVHERCARLLDVGEGDEGITYLAMELAEGQTLDEVMRQGALSPSHAVDLLIQVTAALSAVHEVGLVHCDLSPRNVMVTSRSGRLEAKVLDFGIARSMNIAGRQNQEGELWGFANPAFSAPELLAGADVDARADLYSLGTLGWLMLTGTMPVDDSDAERAVAAVREGNLASWPRVTGVPKRLAGLIQRCLQFEPEHRPASAEEVHRQLLSVRTGRGPGLLRFAMIASAVALLVTLGLSLNAPVAFLESRQGSRLVLSERALTFDSPVLHLTTGELARIDCRYGGFAPSRLRADIARDGEVLVAFPLTPQVDPAASIITLSVAQESWQEVVDGLLRASKDGPVDLILTVPGSSLVRAARVRVDDLQPTVAARVESNGAGLNRSSRLVVDLEDDIGVDHAGVVVALANQDLFRLPLAPSSGSFALGEELAKIKMLAGVAPLGGGTLTISAVDRAGNECQLPQISFEAMDLGVPHVTRISGPAGQVGLTLKGDQLRFRVRLSELEAGCSLRCHTGVVADAVLIPLPELGGSLWHTLEVSAAKLGGAASSVVIYLAVVDPAGNTEEREFTTAIVDRNPLIAIKAMSSGEAPVVWTDAELLFGPNGGSIDVGVSAPYGVVGARLKRGAVSLDESLATVRKDDASGTYELRIGAMEAGVYKLLVALAEEGNEQLAPYQRSVDVRVLPHQIDVHVPSSTGRFLKPLLDDGVLMKRSDTLDQFGEGRGWRLDAELRPYVGGEMWLNGAFREVRSITSTLLPGFTPVAGRNVLALRLTDVLGRAVRLTNADGSELHVSNGRATVADFWWSDALPRLVGEAVLVEHGQPVRIRIRLPLPFDDPSRLRLSYPNGENAATHVALEGNGSIASFDLTFAQWSAAAKLGGTREEFAQGLDGSIEASVVTPASDGDGESVSLSLRTTRSTLSPMRLGDFVDVSTGLKDLRLLPLLAPHGEFIEPVPAKPQRFAFRPQWPVNVRNMMDIMLQDREFEWGQARALMTFATTIVTPDVRLACVHHFDPLGIERLQPQHLLPPQPADATGRVPSAPANDAVLTGVDFFQAWTYSRLLGLAVANDPSLFRLPFGCELELAAFSDVRSEACHGVRAHGGAVQMSAFLADTMPVPPWTAAQTRSFGDVIKTSYGFEFVGLDFGVREWVLDLPHMPGAEKLLATWTSDHTGHLGRVMDIAAGKREMLPARLGLQRQLAVVRGLAFGEAHGLIDENGKALVPDQHRVLPDSVPGVLRTEQLSRDGRGLLSGRREPRLQQVGFRLVGDAKKLAKKWGYR